MRVMGEYPMHTSMVSNMLCLILMTKFRGFFSKFCV